MQTGSSLKERCCFLCGPVNSTDPLRILTYLPYKSAEQLRKVFGELSTLTVEEDGLVFLPDTARVVEIREDNVYGGMRVTMQARLGKIRIPLQIDIGFGDAVTPDAEQQEFPTLLDFNAPVLLTYLRESAIAEK